METRGDQVPKLTIKKWSKFMTELAHDFWPTVERGMRSGARRGLNVLHEAVEKAPPASQGGSVGAFDRGGYKRGWKVYVGINSIRYYNPTAYSDVIEQGRQAGAKPPPAEVLIPWVRRKLNVKGSEAEGVARAVAFTIGRRGLKGRYVLTNAEDRIGDAIEQDVLHELDKRLEKKVE
jgi:hypothetical protein